MKKLLLYFAVLVTIAVTGCTDFGQENQLTLPAPPAIDITNIVTVAGGQGITFTVAPAGQAGFYSWALVKSDAVDPNIKPDQVLKLQAITGRVANGLVDYTASTSKTVTVSGLTPYTVYQIYAVASSPDGVVGTVKNANIRTADNGAKPGPSTIALSGENATLTFNEPIQKGAGKVFVSYFAINTLAPGANNALTIKPGFESFNPQNVEVPAGNLTISGSAMVVKLPNPPAGAYASITYEADAVKDLEGNACNAYSTKANTVNATTGVPSGGITVHVANKTWGLQSGFEPDEVQTFAVWDKLTISAYPDKGITVAKKIATVIPNVTYVEPGKKTTIDVVTWGLISGIPAFLLPEEPARGAVVNLAIPDGAYQDVYGNTSKALNIDGNLLYSYGYTMADIVGTYDIAMTSYWNGALTESGIVIEQATGSKDGVLIKNLLDAGTVIKGTFDPVAGTLSVDDGQVLIKDADFGADGIYDILFVNADAAGVPVVFNIPTPGKMISPAQWWGYYLINDADEGWYDAFTESTWSRASANAAAPALKASVKKAPAFNFVKHQGGRKLHK